VLKVYAAMGSPQYPTRAQAQQMNAATALPPPEQLALHDGTLDLNLTPNELVLLHIGAASHNMQKRSLNHPQE
jgi:hypothetical protein